jgi:DNA-binding PadR family transcriptional regulator
MLSPSEIILETLKDAQWMMTNVIFTDYHTSYKNIRKFLRNGGRPENLNSQKNKENLQRFYSLLNYLEKQELIEKKKDGFKKTFWRITKKGVKNLKIKKGRKNISPLKMENKKEDFLKVIIFDIPEIKKRERGWLRRTLINFEFNMLQKSVWTGKNKLPKEFFDHVKNLDLIPYIHIFEINKKGSIDFK